ncbi:MAG: hypothetical protein K2N73_02545 [Lachnospiraceae bacterium]|nr:hypothetical protein [Lachnospiraceae bacterium]
MEINQVARMTRQELMECISNRKSEIAEKIKNGETEPTFSIGSATFTAKEWDKLLAKVDRNNEEVRLEQERRKEALEKEEQEKKDGLSSLYLDMHSESTKRNYYLEKINGTYKTCPYDNMAQNGVISYKGVEFVCDYKKNAICLGDMSNRKDVLTIPLEDGGSLMVNRNNLGDLAKAISMFKPEDINRIMRAIADDNKAQEAQREIEDDENSIGDDAEEKLFEDENMDVIGTWREDFIQSEIGAL